MAVSHHAAREGLPGAFCRVTPGTSLAGPKLHTIALRVRLGPGNPDRVDFLCAAQIDERPLRIERIVFTSEGACQIRIALPIGIGIAIRKNGIVAAVASTAHAPVRQSV